MDKDLAEFNEPISDLFAGKEDSPGEIANADAEFFEQNGYSSGIQLLDQEQIDVLRS